MHIGAHTREPGYRQFAMLYMHAEPLAPAVSKGAVHISTPALVQINREVSYSANSGCNSTPQTEKQIIICIVCMSCEVPIESKQKKTLLILSSLCCDISHD